VAASVHTVHECRALFEAVCEGLGGAALPYALLELRLTLDELMASLPAAPHPPPEADGPGATGPAAVPDLSEVRLRRPARQGA